ncbi:MAG: Ig-like domain repeat protein [Chloroflexi bacterium]|nr:Ig-like domain repeat protein [Chloroflexota bacterium]
MISRRITRQRKGRKVLTALATMALVTSTLVIGSTALAVNPSTTGLFELDTSTTVPPCPVTTPATTICGNANTADSPTGGADDWANVYKSATGLGTASPDHAFARTFITDPVSGAETSFYTGGGSKDVNDIPQWQYGTTNDPVPDKDDIANLFAAAYTDSGSGHTIIYFGMDRYDNSGDSETGFWFFKNTVSLDSTGHFTGVHSVGDVLVLANWGGSNPVGDITVYQWVGGKNPLQQLADNAAGDCALAGASSNFCAVVNRTNDTPPWPFIDKNGSSSIRPLELFEAGLDLNAVFGSDRCFSSFLGATRSSHSTTAQLKDFALGNFEQCGASLTTQVSASSIFVGQTVADNATVHVSGGSAPPAPTGTVTFRLNGAAFDTKPLSGATKSANDYTVTSATYTATTPGRFCFSASWPGDTNYTGGPYADQGGALECFDVAKRPSSTDTLSSPTGGSITPGTSASDTATVSGSGSGPTPTGTVDFYLCQPSEVTAGGCVTGGTKIGTAKTLSATGVATSDSSTNTTAVGKYCWRAEYSGDSNYLSSSHTDSTNECFTTIKLPSSTDTLSSPTGGDVVPGTSVTDSATVTGTGGTPTGTVDFYLCQPSEVTAGGCVTGGMKIGTTKTLSATGTATSDASTNTTAIGTYCWRAEYSGNALYNPSSHTDSTNECFTTVKQPSSTDTLSSPNGDIAVGDSVSDAATVSGSSGGPTPTGTVDFYLCQPSEVTAGGCVTGGTKVGATMTLSAAGMATSDSSTNTITVGKYCWRAEYSGDGFYLPSSHTDSTNECFTVKDTTSATSAQRWLPNDSATITSTGGTTLSGTLSFTLYSGTTCAANGGTILRAAETFTIANASPVTRTTTNTTFTVLLSQDVSWLVEFTSSNPLVGSSSHCESTSLTINN